MKSEMIGGRSPCNKEEWRMTMKNRITLPRDWITVLIVSHCVSNAYFRRDLAAYAGDRGYDPRTIMEATDRQLERALRGVLNGQDFRME